MAEIFRLDAEQNIEPPIEEQEDGSFLVGEPDSTAAPPEEELEEPTLRAFDKNLAEDMDDKLLNEIGSQVHEDYTIDLAARSEWEEIYKKGLKSLAPEEASEAGSSSDSRSSRKLTMVIHPVIAEAATQFQARAIGELYPPQGPVGTVVLGETTKDLADQADRVGTYINYQITEEMEEYFPDHDQMLFHLPLVGHTFKKSYFDTVLRRVTSQFVHADNLVVDANAVSLASALRTTEIIRISTQAFNDYVKAEFYIKPDTAMDVDPSIMETVEQEVSGIEEETRSEDAVVLLEQHVWRDDVPGDESSEALPYTVTINEANQKVVAIRRNWDENDTTYYGKQVWYASYKFLPGLGFYGFGLYHIIGGLGKAATGALRSLLDAAAYANMQGGFKLKGSRMEGGEVRIAPGEFPTISAPVDDIKKGIMALPFKEPSPTMMSLLQYVVDTAKQFANSTETNISDANQNTPVGTTVALLEENARVFSAVHKRLHNSQKQEFKLIAKLNGIYMPNRYPFHVKGENRYVLRADFNDKVDVVPVSDPATFSSTQRIAQGQASMQMAQAYPQFHDIPTVLRRMYESLRIPNYEEMLIDPNNTDRLDAVAENSAILMGKPIRAYLDQDHKSHMIVLDDWFTRLPPQLQKMNEMAFVSHRAEHMSLFYRVQVQIQLASQLPAMPNFRDPNVEVPELTPEMDAKISQAAAVVVNQSQQPPLGPPMPQLPGQGAENAANDPVAAAKMLAQAEAMSIQAKTKAEIESKQAKSQSDMQIKQFEAQMDLKIEQVKAKARMDEARMREMYKAETDSKKADEEIKIMWAKAEAEILIAREKAQAQLKGEMATANVKLIAHDRESQAKADAARNKDTTIDG